MTPDPARRFVEHALAVEWEAVPASARTATQAFLFDSLAVGVAGRSAIYADAVRQAATLWTGGAVGEGLVLGEPGLRLPAPYAAYANAYQIHAQEYDCVHEAAVAHPMASVCAALLAEAGREPVAGPDFLAAVIAGVDVIATLGVAVKGPLKFFRPATAGIFGCVAALSRLRRVVPHVATRAFGHALALVSGTMQSHVEGKPTLALQVAAAARSAVEAFDLARMGVPSPEGAIGGPFGYMALFENDPVLAPELDRLGKLWRVEEVSWKPFPTGRAAQGAIVALKTLMAEHGVSSENLVTLEYHGPPLIHRLVGRRPRPDMTVAYARLCFPWLGGVVLREGDIGLDAFTPERLADPMLAQLAEKIVVVADDNPDLSAFVPAYAEASLRDGRVVRIAVERQLGAPDWPLTLQQQLEKARQCLVFGGLSSSLVEPLHDFIANLDRIGDVAAALTILLESDVTSSSQGDLS
jgi:2-methylcitrate dehydratase PrpD